MEEDKTLKNIMDDDFGKIILKIRKENNLTQKELADLINVSDRTISKWENGQSVPDLICIKNICKALNISPSSLVLDKKSKKEHFVDTINKVHKFITLKRIIAFIFSILFILLLSFYINNRNTVTIYKLKLYNDDITFHNGYIINTKYKNILVIEGLRLNREMEYNSIQVELYTIVNGDKIVIYRQNSLNNIFIEEITEYNDYKKVDIYNSITKDFYISILVNNVDAYEGKISIIEKYQNNRVISRNIPSDNRVLNVIDNNFNVNSELLKLGYEYDNQNKSYQKNYKDYQIIISIDNKVILLKENNNKYKIVFNYEDNHIEYNEYNSNGEKNNQMLLINNKIHCLLGKCKNQNFEINEIIKIYNEIRDIL